MHLLAALLKVARRMPVRAPDKEAYINFNFTPTSSLKTSNTSPCWLRKRHIKTETIWNVLGTHCADGSSDWLYMAFLPSPLMSLAGHSCHRPSVGAALVSLVGEGPTASMVSKSWRKEVHWRGS